MTHILRGDPLAVLKAIHDRWPPSRALHLHIEPDFPLPWAGARAWLAHLRARLGDEAVLRALAPHRAVLSIPLRGLFSELSEEEKRRRDGVLARLPGFMSHSRMSLGPLADAWAGALAPLVRMDSRPVVIPDLSAVDPGTVVLLRQLLRRLDPAERPDFVIGHVAAPDVHPFRITTLSEQHLAMLEGLPDTLVEGLPESAGSPAPPAPVLEVVPVDPLDDRAERRAWEALRAAAGPPDEALLDEVVRGMRLAFGALGFEAAQRLGTELLARVPELPRAVAREAHALVAVSAYNLRVRRVDHELAEQLRRHLEAALDAEDDPVRRSHLLYRLGTNTARLAGGDPARGIELTERAIAEARAPDVPPGEAAHLEAWALNGRAYLLTLQQRSDEALRGCERAAELLEEAARLSGAPEIEILGGRVVLRSNLAEVHALRGELEQAARWQAAVREAEALLGDIMPVWPNRWVRILRAQHRLEDAAQKAEEGVALARRHLNPVALDRYAMELGDLRYRLGDALAAYRCYAEVIAIRRRLGEADEQWRAEISAGQAALRADLLEEAEAAFGEALASPAGATPAARAELSAALALVAASRGDAAAAQDRMNAAIAGAVATGVRDVLLRVARAAGEVCLRLGARPAAREAFTRALRIADTEVHAGGERAATGGAAPAADVVGVLLGLRRAGEDDPLYVLRALSLLPAALADADAWWELQPLLEALSSLVGDPALDAPELREALGIALQAAAQRPDARLHAAPLSL